MIVPTRKIEFKRPRRSLLTYVKNRFLDRKCGNCERIQLHDYWHGDCNLALLAKVKLNDIGCNYWLEKT